MFVQMIFGRVADAAALRRQLEQWHAELAADAPGWLGSAGGVTADDRVVLAARFESAEAAAANSQRPDQGRWWAATEACLAGPATFLDTTDVTVLHEHSPQSAGFVQVMRARTRDRQRFEAIEAEIGPTFLELRPDVLAGYVAWLPDGSVAAIDHFRSEAEARAGEAIPMPEDLTAKFQEWMSLMDEVEWYDLTDPWVAAPAP